jgi:predicted DNA-binding protein
MPAQITIRLDPELVERLKADARRAGRTMNMHVSAILAAATNPDMAGDEAQQLRERLRRAGLLLEAMPNAEPPPDDDALERARAEAGRGTPLSDLVSELR